MPKIVHTSVKHTDYVVHHMAPMLANKCQKRIITYTAELCTLLKILGFAAYYTYTWMYTTHVNAKSSVSSHAHRHYTDIVLNTLNPDRAVEIITPGICGCQWISLISDWPWCRNSSWGGKSFIPSTLAPTSHDSTDRSHWLMTSSAPEAANTLESTGLHSTDVTGALCCLKFATGRPVYRYRWNKST